MDKRIQRENQTVTAMIRLFCHAQHQKEKPLCHECEQLRLYTAQRNQNCPFGAQKPVCNRCQVHCYSAFYQQKIKQVMRYAGPRMLFYHPILAFWHFLDKRRPTPLTQGKRKKS
jgi:hypothetical protein